MTKPLLIEHDDGVDRVTLNRPESLNALNPDMIDALNLYFEGLQRDRATRVVVLKGAGASFCAGLDLKHAMARRAGQQEPPGVTESLDSQRRIADIVLLMRRCPQPIIALVQGSAAGGGFALALAADIRIATKSARMNCAPNCHSSMPSASNASIASMPSRNSCRSSASSASSSIASASAI